eukprot:c5225_g1_i2.p1 GENE.c5225_g1_i2~~c5225_g1_i2.p1  ORF type:complete len:552 (+),score=75.50 c5225_g1_i2:39-1658(+)
MTGAQWSTTQLVVLSAITATSSLLSLMGSTFVISSYISRKVTSFHDSMIFVLACINIPQAISYAPGPFFDQILSSETVHWSCKIQGFACELFGLMSVAWTCCLAHSLFAWIVLKKSIPALRSYRWWYFIFSVAFPVIISAIIFSHDAYGPAGVWCWITDKKLHFPFFWGELALGWIFNVIVFFSVFKETTKRTSKNARNLKLPANHVLFDRNKRTIFRKLSLYLLVFILEWLFGLINRFVSVVHGTSFPLTVLHCLFVPLQGWMNAVVFGSMHLDSLACIKHVTSWLCRKKISSRDFLLSNNAQRSDDTPAHETDNRVDLELFDANLLDSRQKRFLAQTRINLYVVTWNMGECSVSTNEVLQFFPSNIHEYDVIVVGVQECLYLEKLKAVMNQTLNQTDALEYTMHSREMGSTNTWLGYHGHISLICFTRRILEDAGVIQQMEMASQRVSRGVNYGLSRAQNKGVVGLTFRLFGSQVTFLSAHFAADSSKQSQFSKRVVDSRSILRDMIVDYDDVGCDLQVRNLQNINQQFAHDKLCLC